MERLRVIHAIGAVTLVVAVTTVCSGCEVQKRAAAPSEPADGVYAVELQAATPANLPKCTSALAGTTAFAASPASLWSCLGNSWVQIPCTTILSGAVAYASATKTLWACVSGTWTQIALPAEGAPGPPGATGPQGPTGATGADGANGATSLVVQAAEPAGANCASGGTKIQSGVDADGDQTLTGSEISATTYVCNGSNGGASGGGTGGGGGQGGTGGGPICTKAVDLIVAIDTSGSMGDETAATVQNLPNLAASVRGQGIDLHVIMIAGDNVCVPAPLGGGACPDEKLPGYRHVQQVVGSTNSLQQIIATYPQWKDSVRVGADKAILVVSDDDSDLNASAFTAGLLALDSPMFDGFQFHAIASSESPDVCASCIFLSCGSCAHPCCDRALSCTPISAAEGKIYKQLAQSSDGIFGDLCLQNFQPTFGALTASLVARARCL